MGKLPIARAWTDDVTYESEVRTHAGALWQAKRDTGRAPPHEDWTCLARAGLDGAHGQDGRSFSVRRTYDPAATYSAFDVVMTGGSSFVALQDEPGPCPGDGWQLLASRGSRGAPGEKGDRGDRGERGFAAASPIALVADEEGRITLTLDDGKELTADLYPLLTRVLR